MCLVKLINNVDSTSELKNNEANILKSFKVIFRKIENLERKKFIEFSNCSFNNVFDDWWYHISYGFTDRIFVQD